MPLVCLLRFKCYLKSCLNLIAGKFIAVFDQKIYALPHPFYAILCGYF